MLSDLDETVSFHPAATDEDVSSALLKAVGQAWE